MPTRKDTGRVAWKITSASMKIHSDMTLRAAERIDDLPWQPAPDGSVDRRMLDRDGGEVARATSVVRYPPNSRFPAHLHGGGEEFLVLEGVFSDEHGHYAAGSYVRNPIGTRHAPYSDEGCVIFVKLRQFEPADDSQFVVDSSRVAPVAGGFPGWRERPLHEFGAERVVIVELDAGTTNHEVSWEGGAEFLVLAGELLDENDRYPANSWLRLPPGSRQQLSSESGARFYLKTGHLRPSVCA